MTPDTVVSTIQDNWLAAVVGALVALPPALMALRRNLSSDRASAASDDGKVDVISRYKEQLEIEQASTARLGAENKELRERNAANVRECTLAQAEAERWRLKYETEKQRGALMAAKLRKHAPHDPMVQVITSAYMGLEDDDGGRR